MILLRTFVFALVILLAFTNLEAQVSLERSQAQKYLVTADKLLGKAKVSEALLNYKLADSLSNLSNDLESVYKSQYGILYANLRLGNAPFVLDNIDSTIVACTEDLGDTSNVLAKLIYFSAIVENEFKEGLQIEEKAMEAIGIFEKHLPSSELDIASCYNLLGISAYRKKDFTRALEFYQKSLAIKQRINGEYHISLGSNYNNIGIIYALTDRPEKAVEYYKKSLAIKIKRYGKDHPRVANSQFNIGEVYLGLKQYKKALPYTLESIRINRINEEQQAFKLAHRLTSLGNLYYHLGDSEKAIQAGKESILYYEKSQNGNFFEATGHQGLGSIYTKVKEFEKAIDQYQRAAKMLAGDEWEMTDHGNPIVNPEISSERLYQVFFRKADAYDQWFFEKDSIFLLEMALETREVLIETIYFLQQDISAKESSFDFSEDIRPIYEAALENCYQLFEKTGNQEFIDRAFHIYSSCKASLLKQQFQEQQAKLRSQIPDSLLLKSDKLKDAINQYTLQLKNADKAESTSELEDTIFNLKLEQNKMELYFEKNFPFYSSDQLSIDKIDIDEFMSNQKDNSNLMLAWFYGEEILYLFHNQNDQLQFQRICKSEKLDDQILALNALVKNAERAEAQGNSLQLYSEFTALSHGIYSQLIPFSIQESKRITLISDGLLNLIPFELLIDNFDEQDQIVDYNKLSYLLKKAPIRYAYSPRFIDSQSKDDRGEGMLVIAPNYEEESQKLFALREGFSKLTFAQEEADFMESRFGADVLRGSQATDLQLKEQIANYNVLHFAMHAYSDDESPEYSSLIFPNNDNPSDEKNLHAYEISLMKIPAEMVVLSACNTGSGKIVNGEGTMSLARSFLEAGTRNVLMSLWQVDDKATSFIFQDFYENLDKSIPKDAALQKAKLKYLDEHKRVFPFYWASFILMGDSEPLTISSSSLPKILIGGGFLFFLVLWFLIIKRKSKS